MCVGTSVLRTGRVSELAVAGEKPGAVKEVVLVCFLLCSGKQGCLFLVNKTEAKKGLRKLSSAMRDLLSSDKIRNIWHFWNKCKPSLTPLFPVFVNGWPLGCLTPTRQWCCQQWKCWWSSWNFCPRILTITTCCWRNLPLRWLPCCLESLKFSMLPWGTSTWLCKKGKTLKECYSWVCYLRPSGISTYTKLHLIQVQPFQGMD